MVLKDFPLGNLVFWWTEFNFSKLGNIAFPKISIGFLWKMDQLLYFRVLINLIVSTPENEIPQRKILRDH